MLSSSGLGLVTRKSFAVSVEHHAGAEIAWALLRDVRHAKEVIKELGMARSQHDISPVMVYGTSGDHTENQRFLGGVKKQQCQRIVAKLNSLAHLVRLEVCHFVSCQPLLGWESELSLAITASTRSLGIQSGLNDLGFSCAVIVVVDTRASSFAAPWSQRCVEACGIEGLL